MLSRLAGFIASEVLKPDELATGNCAKAVVSCVIPLSSVELALFCLKDSYNPANLTIYR